MCRWKDRDEGMMDKIGRDLAERRKKGARSVLDWTAPCQKERRVGGTGGGVLQVL